MLYGGECRWQLGTWTAKCLVYGEICEKLTSWVALMYRLEEVSWKWCCIFSISALDRIIISATFTKLIATEGVRGLAKGFSLNIIKGPITLSLSLTTYDFLTSHLHIKKDYKSWYENRLNRWILERTCFTEEWFLFCTCRWSSNPTLQYLIEIQCIFDFHGPL